MSWLGNPPTSWFAPALRGGCLGGWLQGPRPCRLEDGGRCGPGAAGNEEEQGLSAGQPGGQEASLRGSAPHFRRQPDTATL